ncbi:MAG: (d)CMP kinase [Candidatus Caenarcaniphilales bacterium]|jgi:cytidylate kinase|nr:(d)CMP kinase [Candidatus Caenarcaniphilales bacterium]
MSSQIIIAIDGPAASGKSTLAKLLAKRLGLLYIDSGAMFRAVTLAWIQKTNGHKSEADAQILDEILSAFNIEFLDNSKTIVLNSNDISTAIRDNQVSQLVSYISTFSGVRSKLLDIQRKLSSDQSVIMDGRDIGTVVFPNADFKFFMIASPLERAKRREKELAKRGERINIEELAAQIEERDRQDSSRAIAPLKKADDAIVIDTDNKTIDEVLGELLMRVSTTQTSN